MFHVIIFISLLLYYKAYHSKKLSDNEIIPKKKKKDNNEFNIIMFKHVRNMPILDYIERLVFFPNACIIYWISSNTCYNCLCKNNFEKILLKINYATKLCGLAISKKYSQLIKLKYKNLIRKFISQKVIRKRSLGFLQERILNPVG